MKNVDDREAPLSTALAALRDDDESMSASPAVEARLRTEVRALRARSARGFGPGTRTGQGSSHGFALALAASLTVVVSASAWWLARIETAPAPIVAKEVATDFVPLQYAGVPSRSMQIVRLEVPRAALSSMGLSSFDAPRPGASPTVLADVMVGEDGLARAVRFVRVLSHQE